MTVDMPQQAALNTTEILENILSYLPNRTIFGVQRVCRQWRNAIAGSPTIQERLFLRLKHQTPEIRATNHDYDIFDLRNPHRKYRLATAAEVESAHEELPYGARELFMPVALNPMLEKQIILSQMVNGFPAPPFNYSARFSVQARLKQFAQHGSSRASFITDPPCMELEVELHYFMARSHLPGFNYMKCHADLKSEKPLTIGDTIDHVLKPKRFQIRNHEGEFTGIMEDVTAAEKIEELEKQHNCRFMLSDVHFTLPLNDTKVCRQFFTEAEYVRYRPKGEEFQANGQTGEDSPDNKRAEDGSAANDTAGDESTEVSPQ